MEERHSWVPNDKDEDYARGMAGPVFGVVTKDGTFKDLREHPIVANVEAIYGTIVVSTAINAQEFSDIIDGDLLEGALSAYDQYDMDDEFFEDTLSGYEQYHMNVQL